jgi:hypothetical protein
MKTIVHEEFFDQISLVPEANNKIVHAIGRKYLHDVPDDRPATYLHERLRFDLCLLGQAGPQSSGKYDSFHKLIPIDPAGKYAEKHGAQEQKLNNGLP